MRQNRKQYAKDVLAKAIRDTGQFQKLVDLLPAEYEPPVVAVVETDELDGAAENAA